MKKNQSLHFDTSMEDFLRKSKFVLESLQLKDKFSFQIEKLQPIMLNGQIYSIISQFKLILLFEKAKPFQIKKYLTEYNESLHPY
jgi:hypothetical protein